MMKIWCYEFRVVVNTLTSVSSTLLELLSLSALLDDSGTAVSAAIECVGVCELVTFRGDVLASEVVVVVVASALLRVDDDCDVDWLECDGVSRTSKSSSTFDNNDDDDESWLLLKIVSKIRPTAHPNKIKSVL